ncbi:hypothetical protein Hanom_Chr06g00573091 [Helianthus anomalus]
MSIYSRREERGDHKPFFYFSLFFFESSLNLQTFKETLTDLQVFQKIFKSSI